jgi:hypothetical protein
VQQRDPAGGHEERGDERGSAVRQPRDERCDHRHAGHRERDGDQAQTRQARRDQRNEMGEQEMKGCTAALADHGLEDIAERLPADEEDERLVLVWGPGVQGPEEEDPQSERDRRDSEPVAVPGPGSRTREHAGRWHSLDASAGGGRAPC